MTTNTDQIEKQIVLDAPLARVWRAVTSAKEFGKWFGVVFEGEFVPGAHLKGRCTVEGYDHITFDLYVEKMEPETLFSYRWHPYAIEMDVDYSSETPTLVEFRMEAVDAGTHLTITESGFDKIPAGRRDEAFRMNDQGWSGQTKNLEGYVTSR